MRRVARFHERITAGLAHPDLATFTSLVEQYRAENDVPLEQIAAVLAALAAGDTPLLLTEDLPDHRFAETRDSRGDSRSHPRQHSFDDDRRGERALGEGRSAERMETYRIEVGHAHQVKPANIVGAIANESGLNSRFIGKIVIFDEYSTVDLLAGMPRELLHMLKKVWVAGRRLNITRLDEAAAPAPEERPFVEKLKASAPAEDRPVAKKPKAIPDRKDRPVGKKFKTKSKPKRTIAKSKGSRSSAKRLQRTR